jgi:hypothetical protein
MLGGSLYFLLRSTEETAVSGRNGSGSDVWEGGFVYHRYMQSTVAWVIDNLLPNQHPGDRPDVLARVFRLKFKAILDDLLKKNCLGIVMAYVYVIEFQKRGLTHAHILNILNHQHKPRRPDDYDRVVSAEIPDPDEHPMLHETVTKCMMHGPCGSLKANALCIKDNKCKKNFPKSFNSETMQDGNGYPVYRRRNNGKDNTKTKSGA